MHAAAGSKPEALCARLAARQYGCISLAQACNLGMSDDAVHRLVKRGVWVRVLPGVYLIEGAPRGWKQQLMAAWLWLGDEAAVSHRSAAALWRIPGFPPGPVELVTTTSRQSRAGIEVHRTKQLGKHETGWLGPFAVTTPTRTLVDLSAVAGPEVFEVAFHFCLYQGSASLARLRHAAQTHQGRGARGAPLLREMLDLYSSCDRPPESPLEVRVSSLISRAKLPPPQRQYAVFAGGSNYRIDLAYPSARLAIEVDSYRWHSSRLSWDSDKLKIAALQAAGWNVVQATYELSTTRQRVLLGAITAGLGAALFVEP